jgi:acyl carrier protein
MNTKQEALRLIREETGDRSITFHTTITALAEDFDTDMVDLVDSLENEFGVELSEELLVDVDTVGELCQMVARASRDGDMDEVE